MFELDQVGRGVACFLSSRALITGSLARNRDCQLALPQILIRGTIPRELLPTFLNYKLAGGLGMVDCVGGFLRLNDFRR